MDNKSKSNYFAYMDVLNIISALGVVFLHCNGLVHGFLPTPAWAQALFVEVCVYWPVPIFLMLSGATLMGYRERYSTKEFFKKRFSRTVIPFVAWTVIVSFLLEISPFEIGFKEYFNLASGVQIENIYWFFVPLFSIYFAMPVISLLKDNRKILWYMFGVAFALTSVFPTLFSLFGLVWKDLFQSYTLAGFLILPVLGYLLSTSEIDKKKRILLYALGIASVAFRYIYVYKSSYSLGYLDQTLFGYSAYLGFYSIFLAVAVFVFVKNSKIVEKMSQNKTVVKILKNVSACSFGVYLCHMSIMRFLDDFVSVDTYVWRLLWPFGIYLIALAFVFIMRKIPIVNKIIP